MAVEEGIASRRSGGKEVDLKERYLGNKRDMPNVQVGDVINSNPIKAAEQAIDMLKGEGWNRQQAAATLRAINLIGSWKVTRIGQRGAVYGRKVFT